MDLKQQKYICTIAKHRNLTKAANELFVSQSTLSLFLSKLERELGMLLFERKNKYLAITQAGEYYVETAQKMLDMREDLYHRLQVFTDVVDLRLGLASTRALKIVTFILAEYKELFTRLKLSITAGKANPMLKLMEQQKLDFVLYAQSSATQPENYHVDTIRKEPFVILLSSSHPLAHLAATQTQLPPVVDMSLFANQSIILPSEDTCDGQVVRKIIKYYDLNPKVFCKVTDPITILDMVENNIGITFFPIPYQTRESLYWCKPDKDFYRHLVIAHQNDHSSSLLEKLLIEKIHEAYEQDSIQQYE